MIDVPGAIDTHLRAKWEQRQRREVAGGRTWRASLLGSCLRRQYLELHLKLPAIAEDDELSLRRFEVGEFWNDAMEQWLRGAYPKHETYRETELSSLVHNIGAHADFVVGEEGNGRFGIEVKSVQSKWFWYRAKEGGVISPENMMQAAVCSMLWRLPWVVVSISKDDLTMRQDAVTPDLIDLAMTRLHVLNTAKVDGNPPPCTCTDPKGEYGGSGWKFCPYYEGDLEKRRAKGAKPDGPCCVGGGR